MTEKLLLLIEGNSYYVEIGVNRSCFGNGLPLLLCSCYYSFRWGMQMYFIRYFNPIQDGHFWGCSRRGGLPKSPPSLKSVTHILQWWNALPKEDPKIYQLRDTPPEFCWNQHFFHQKSAYFVISRNTDIDCILIHNFLFF